MTKDRKSARNTGGRPSNRQRWEEQQAEIARLRQLVVHRRQADETWRLIDRIITTINELEDWDTSIKAATYDGGAGHSAERPLLPGVWLATDGADIDHPDGDGVSNKGNRNLNHSGTYAGEMLKWFYRTVRWTIASTERKLAHKEPDPRPSIPKTSNPVKDRNDQTNTG